MGATGLEPVTFAMSTQRSNQLSYAPAGSQIINAKAAKLS